MDKKTFIDKIKLLFSESEETEEVKAAENCACKGEKDCECDKLEEEMAEDEPEIEAPEKEECDCEDKEDCECEEKEEEVLEPELKEEAPESSDVDNRLEALEKALANISESMSSIDNLSQAVSELANSPAEEEVKLSKASGKGAKKGLNSRDEKLKALATRSK